MNVDIRPARPEDAAAAAPLLYDSGPEILDYIFTTKAKGPSQNFVRAVFPKGPGEIGYRNHTVVTLAGRVVGLGAAFGSRQMLGFTLATTGQILAYYGLVRGCDIIRRGLQVESLTKPPAGSTTI